MKKDNLKELVNQHRSEFDATPPPDMWGEIDKAIDKEKSLSTNWKSILMKAVAVIAISVTSIGVYRTFSEQKTSTQIVQVQPEQLPTELKEAEEMYGNRISVKLTRLASFEKEYPGISSEVNTELASLDETYQELKAELGEAPLSPDVIQAMVETYQLKASILEEVLMGLEENKKEQNEIIWN